MSIKTESATAVKEQPQAEPETKELPVAEESAEIEEVSETSEPDTSEEGEEEAESTEKDEQEEEAKEGEKPRKRNGFKKRIDRLSRRLSDAEKDALYWREQALKGQAPKEQVENKPVTKAEGEPNQDDFESHADWVKAVARWEAKQEWKQLETKKQETQLKTEHQQKVESFHRRIQDFKETVEDFDEVMESVDDIPMSAALQTLILESENGHELTYELAKNREELERISKLAPLAAAKALGSFEASLKAQAKKEIKETKTSKAPEPIKPVGSKGVVATRKSIYDPNLSQAEYEALRAKQRAQRA